MGLCLGLMIHYVFAHLYQEEFCQMIRDIETGRTKMINNLVGLHAGMAILA
jgi:hypothetical protein